MLLARIFIEFRAKLSGCGRLTVMTASSFISIALIQINLRCPGSTPRVKEFRDSERVSPDKETPRALNMRILGG